MHPLSRLRFVLPCFLVLFALSAVAQAPVERVPPPPAAPADETPYSQDIFAKPLPPEQLAFLKQYAGRTTGDMLQDKPAHKLLWSFIPNCMFHYGRDMPMDDAFTMVMEHSREVVELVNNRYLTFSGHSGPFLAGRGAMWIDLQKGIALGIFFFTPTNGEPTPSVVVFGKQVKEPALKMSQMPPDFVDFFTRWTGDQRIPPITARYFIGGNNKRLLLEHDEDYCAAYGDSATAHPACDEAVADAADVDVNAASYLSDIHYATNGTAWMVSPEQVAWLHLRDSSCGSVLDPLACRIRVTRERTHVILHAPPPRGRR